MAGGQRRGGGAIKAGTKLSRGSAWACLRVYIRDRHEEAVFLLFFAMK